MAFPLIPLIGAGVSALGSIFGGASASSAMNDYKAGIQEQKAENEDWYERRYNEDATQRADAQRMLTLTEDAIRKRNRAAAGRQAVMGGNEASVAAEREANSQATAEAAARIAAAGEARKDRIEESYRNRNQNLQDQLNGVAVAKAQNIAQATQGVTSALGNAMMNIGATDNGDIWSAGGYKKLSANQRAINDAVGMARAKDMAAELTQKLNASSDSYLSQLRKQAGFS